MKEFEDKSHFLIARSLNDMVDDIVCSISEPYFSTKEIYKNARIACAKTLKKFKDYSKVTLKIIENLQMNLIL